MIRLRKLTVLSFLIILSLFCYCRGFLVLTRKHTLLGQKNDSSKVMMRKWLRQEDVVLVTQQQQQQRKTNDDSTIQFISPLLEYGYPMAVEEYENNTLDEKPLLLYLPGFDGTFLCPFLQFPELGTLFDVRCMTISTADRSSFQELTERVIQYMLKETNAASTKRRPIYLAGESFGGILACHVAWQLSQAGNDNNTLQILQGLVLINPATCYDRSRLAQLGPAIAQWPWWKYPAGLLQLLPLFTDDYSFQQLWLIVTAQALPSVIDTPMREAYMGRVAFSLPLVIPTVTPSTLHWRLHAWLETGCQSMTAARLSALQDRHPTLRTLIVVGEKDQTLPSTDEAMRLSTMLPHPCVQIVPGAGHASTCGSRADLAAYMRNHFPALQTKKNGGRRVMKPDAAQGRGVWYGMQQRYDSASIGLNPLLYWSSPDYFREYRP